MKYNPPRFATKILQWFCHAELVEEVEGDLYELFQERVQRQGLFRAKLFYLRDVLHAINPYRASPRKRSFSRSFAYRDRLSHFFTIAFRNMVRSRFSSMLNLCGLAISLTGFLLIALYLIDEATYDSFHPGADHVYRIRKSPCRRSGMSPGSHGSAIPATSGPATLTMFLWNRSFSGLIPPSLIFSRFR
jgi:putative ABC transport system permease protein